MDTHFLQQLFLAKLEEARLYSGLLADQLSAEGVSTDEISIKELENWLAQLDSWQTQTAALSSRTNRIILSKTTGSEAQKMKEKISRKSDPDVLTSLFEGVEIQRQVINKKGPMYTAGYNEVKQVLEVEFKPGTLYRYYDVPEELFLEMLKNPRQAMSFFSRNIRNKFEFKQFSL